MSFERLKEWRNFLGLTQGQFAERAGMSKGTLVGYEVGQRKPGFEALAAIAATGCNINWLLTGAGTMLSDETSEKSSSSPKTPEAKTRELIAQIEQVHPLSARLALLDDLIARAQTAAEISTLRAAVAQLQKHLPPADDEEEIDDQNDD